MFNKICSIFIFFFLLAGTNLFADVQSTRELLSAYSSNNSKVLQSYDQMARSWEEYETSYRQWDLKKLLMAVEFAAAKYEGQEKNAIEKTPYIIHPLNVSWLLWNIGSIRNVNVLTSALLKDTLENTDATESEIKALFGANVLHTLIEVRQSGHALTSFEGQLVKLADLLSNIELDSSFSPDEEKDESYRYAEELLLTLRGTNLRLENNLEERISDFKRKLLGTHNINNYYFDWDWSFFGDNTITTAKIIILDNDTKWRIDWNLYTKMDLKLWDGTQIKIIKENNEYLMVIPSEGSPDKSIKFRRVSPDFFSI